MELRLLGPVELHRAGRAIRCGGPRQRSVLAALAVDAGRAVPTDLLIDRVWGESPPNRVRHALHVYIARLRQLLSGPATDPSAARVLHRSGGYVLEMDPERVDLHRFLTLVDHARGRPSADESATLLGEALGLWRGPPLADLPGQWAARVRQAWQQHYLDTVLAWSDALATVGRPGTALAHLTELAAEHPLVEPVAAALMRALHAAGRSADALEHYAKTRRCLSDELAAEPGAQLRDLHRQILASGVGPTRPDPAPPPAVPRQLPAAPPQFTGRLPEVARLERLADPAQVMIATIDGMAGVGKTALAVHVAHRVADRYPDGQFFLDLHGHTRDISPMNPGEALDRLLRAMDTPGELIPAEPQLRSALWRSRLAGHRVLLLLDNAASAGQVAPLLPGAPGCLVLITSRRRLGGLDVTDTVSLDTLPHPDAVSLFTRATGADRLSGEPPELLTQTVELCGRLPLAIRIAAARLRSHPSWTVAHLLERLGDRRHRLAELEAGEHRITAALELSHEQLAPDQRHTYQMLGLHPGPDLDAAAAAALTGATSWQARRLLDRLLEAHLLQEPTPGRFQFHDLVREHAAGAAATVSRSVRLAAVARLLDHYRRSVPAELDPSAADWLDAELPNLLATAHYAAEHGWPDHCLRLSAALHRHLRARGGYVEAVALHHHALAAARAIANAGGELSAFNRLGDIYWLQGRHAQATGAFQQALRIASELGDRAGELAASAGLGRVHWLQGRYAAATDCLIAALPIARALGDRVAEADILVALSDVHRLWGRHEQAVDACSNALRIARRIGNRTAEQAALRGRGWARRLLGRYEQAADDCERGLRIAREIGHHLGELGGVLGLGHVHRLQGRHPQATECYRHAEDLAARVGNRNWLFEAVHGTGRMHLATGRPDASLACHRQALDLAAQLDQPADVARAHDGLARAYRALGQPAPAQEHWRAALEILTRLNTDHTEDPEATVATIRAGLAEVEPATGSGESGG
jgi:DNA-binding SARP family transcriptional activator/tetratricopeptide (TPR) repeat protein